MAKRDYYEVLGVARNAGETDIKKAYRRVAMKCHPDRNPDDPTAETRFKEATEAYEVLSDGSKRSAYDQFGHAAVDGSSGGFGGQGAGANFTDIFGDVFGDIFGGGGGRRAGPARGADLRYDLELSLEDAAQGTTARIRVPTLTTCSICDGSGARKGTAPILCGTCQGSGQIRRSQGLFAVQQTCPACRGRGRVISDPCDQCRGHGRVEESRTLSVKVPPGVDTGDRIRLAGEGQAGPSGGPAGDLYVQVVVREHPIFRREGADLYCEVPISFVDAALGGELQVPTLSGRVSLKIPAETQTGRLFRLRGKGIVPVRGGGPGDLLCRVVVETPVNLSADQKELLRSFRTSLRGGGHSPRETSWFDAAKKFFEGFTR